LRERLMGRARVPAPPALNRRLEQAPRGPRRVRRQDWRESCARLELLAAGRAEAARRVHRQLCANGLRHTTLLAA